MSELPMTLPIVTGSKLAIKKFSQVSAGKSAAVLPIEAQKEPGAPALGAGILPEPDWPRHSPRMQRHIDLETSGER